MTDSPYFVLKLAAGCLLAAGSALPQQMAVPQALTMQQAMEVVLKNYPSIRVSQEQINAATAGIALARTAYLPRVDAMAQVNRATRNNVFGALLPQSTLPSISGPVIGSNNFGTVWGSAIGATVSWEPFDFGLRGASVAAATATRAQSEAALKRAQFDLLVTAADAYLTVVAAQETTRAAQAGVKRAGTVLRIISAQVRAELRPGADQSRAEAEEAAARTQFIQAQQALEVARANLAQFTGGEPATTPLPAGNLLRLPPEAEAPALSIVANPAVAEQRAAVEQAQAQLRALERSYFPRFYVQGSAYARGTGAEVDGSRLGGANGLAPNVQNYALGFSVTFPVLDLPAIRAREAAQSAVIRSQAAKSEQLALELRAQWNRAVAAINGARRIAANTPVQLTSARAAVQQATARYQSGLGNITEVAEAQRLLTQTEIDDSLARLGVWRGLLAIAAVGGDLQPFLAEASK
ncbi:TolC family protein [Paludibaculum fermentans]|uniref:TolC family protein n=1 Tax=Paludibaculum fermentans TaxID=1473598 RepID=UPI003EB8DDA0